MAALLMYLKQPNCIYLFTYLWLATLAAANAQEMLQPEGKAKDPALASQPIELAALGRSLYLGMLYDCRKDSYIPGVTLWNKKSLTEDLDSRPQLQTSLKFSRSDSLSSKSKLLDVSASMKASFLGGLVEVEGSASFLRDTQTSNKQSRVTMYYGETLRFEQLTMTHLGQITYPQVFDQKSATHVVTAVQYGVQAFMVFDLMVSESQSKKEIEAKLNLMVKKIPLFSLEAKAALKMTDAEKKLAEKISCTFHGNVRLKQTPTTYMEALDLYKQLPTLVKENPENVVPIKVWLYPLCLLDTNAARLEREISSSAVSKIEDIMEELWEAERTCNDLSESTVVNGFRDIKQRLHSFQSSFKIYKTLLLKAVGRILPAIRGGENKSLEDILKIHKSSPFNAGMLNQWLNSAKAELNLLSSYTNTLKGIKIKDSDSTLNSMLLDPNIDVVVCLTFTSLQYEDPFLSTLKEFLKSDVFKELDGEKNMISVASFKKWFNDPDVITKMRESLSRFRVFSEANKDEKRIGLIISAISDPSSPGSSIYLYEKGKLTDTNFQPVSKPPPPIVKDFNFLKGTVSLKLQKPPTGETVSYRVEYTKISIFSGQVEQWRSIHTTNEDITLPESGFVRGYYVRCRIVDKVGVSEASDAVTTNYALALGGTGGHETSFITPSVSSIRKIRIHYEQSSNVISRFKGIQVIFSAGHLATIGDTNWSAKEFIFDDDDQIVSAKLWPNKNGDRIRGLEFVVAKSNGARRTFSIKAKDVGNSVTVDVMSGKCYGIKVRFADEIDQLGFYFI